PRQDQNNLTPQRCLKILCLFRLLHPRTELRVAGGREFNLRSLQALALYPADSLFVGGYLTTPGMPAPEAWKMIEDLGFEVDTVGAPLSAPSRGFATLLLLLLAVVGVKVYQDRQQ